MILKVARNNLGLVRVGMSVSKKISKKAVQRNKIKRKLSALLKTKMPQIKEGSDILFIALPGLETKKFSEIREMCDILLKKARILTMPTGRQEND
jgi:ribonuclease P protein component